MQSTAIHHLTYATVVATVPDQNAVYVSLRNGEGLAAPVTVLLPGPCDGLRIKQAPLPGRGTQGVIAFLNGDLRSGVWLGAYPAGNFDAISNPANSPHLDYQSHWSGFWEALDESGSTTTTWPDGSQAIVGSGFTPTKHIQDANSGKRVVVARTASDYPTPPSPLPVAFNHKSGAKLTISSAGAVEASAAAGQTATITANSATIQIDASGNITITAAGNITATSPGTVHVQAPTINLDDGGTLQSLATAAFVTWAEGHVHSDPQGGTTGAPTTSPPSSGLTTIIKGQ
jgi:sorbitol-specific phosphotransferase system component IIA